MGIQLGGKAPSSSLKLVAAGYYGCGNLGDDALLMGLLNGLDGRHEVVALAGDVDGVKGAFGINAVQRKDIGAAVQAIRDADALVFGGGGLLQDTTSLLSLKYYTHLIDAAAKSRKKIALLGQGIGPIRTFLGRRAARRAFSQCHLITVRDEGSMRTVKQLAPDSIANLVVTDDLAWLAAGEIPKQNREKAVAISARPWKEHTTSIIDAFFGFSEKAQSEGWQVVPVSFDRSMDDDVLERVVPGTQFATTPREMFGILSGVSATVAMRLHAGIFSTAVGVPPTMVSYDDKVTAFARSLGGEALPVEKLSVEALWAAFQRDLAETDRRTEFVHNRRQAGASQSRLNITLLEELLQSGRTEPSV